MSSYVKFQFYVQDLDQGQHNWASSAGGTYNILLTNSAPNVSTWHHLSDVTGEVANGNGYTTGGVSVTISSEGQTSGTDKVVVSAASQTWTATGAGFGPFEYVVMYRQDGSNHGLVAYWDNGSAISLNSGDTFTVTFDPTNGLFQLT